jgi:hypothetical protein
VRLGPEVLPFPLFSEGGKRISSRMKPARGVLRAEGCRRGPEVMTDKTTQLVLSVRPHFDHVCNAKREA